VLSKLIDRLGLLEQESRSGCVTGVAKVPSTSPAVRRVLRRQGFLKRTVGLTLIRASKFIGAGQADLAGALTKDFLLWGLVPITMSRSACHSSAAESVFSRPEEESKNVPLASPPLARRL
jgi:hypothetical protein